MKYVSLLTFVLLWGVLHAQNNPATPLVESLSKHPIRQMEVRGLDYSYIEAGEGETIFFLHGFPDMAGTWDASIDALSGQYHCVAPFLRGYYPTGMAADSNYHPSMVAKDIHALAKGMGIDRYYVVGQDWGALVTYNLINLYPDEVIKAATVAIPHPETIKLTPRAIWRARHFIKFRNERKSLEKTRKDDYAYLDKLYRRWSPGWEEYEATRDLMVSTFSLPGRLEGALGYYWSLNEGTGDEKLDELLDRMPHLPLLTFAGKQDGALTMAPFRRMQKRLGEDFKLVVVEEAGHFLHQEVPSLFLQELKSFLMD